MKYGELQIHIGAQQRGASEGGQIEVLNPSNGEVIAKVPALTAEDLPAVFAAAELGAAQWRETDGIERGRILLHAAQLVREHASELAEIITSELGKLPADAAGEVEKSAQFLEYYGGMGRDEFGGIMFDGRPNTVTSRVREPLGVVALITPWNDPLLTPCRKLGPALISGNAVIIKPASATPLCVMKLAELLREAGLPDGVLTVVTGRGDAVVHDLIDHPAIAGVSFTGSTETGMSIQKQLAGKNIRVQTEMGGKNTLLVMDDADLDLVESAVVAGGLGQVGQRCTATSRIVVHEAIADELQDRLVKVFQSQQVGPATAPGVTVGPVVDSRARESILEHRDRAVAQGARVIAAAPLTDGQQDRAFLVAPALLEVSTKQDIWNEEVFGPIIGMAKVASFEEGVAAVNDTSYGLAAAIFTRSLANAFEFARRANAGQVSINHPTTGWDVHHPFGGFGDSGSGYKEQGRQALEFYTRCKTVALRSH